MFWGGTPCAREYILFYKNMKINIYQNIYNIYQKYKIRILRILAFKFNITKGINIYKYLSISPSIITKLNMYGIKIRSPYSEIQNRYYTKMDSIEKMMSCNKNNKYLDYYYSLNRYINNDDAYKLGFDLYNKKWKDYNPLDKINKQKYIDIFKYTIGYHELIAPKAKKISTTSILSKNNIIVENIHISGRFGSPFITYKGALRNNIPKGIVIAIHGRNTNPDYVFGINNKKSYSREFGNYWIKEGYIVYAPQVDWSLGLPLVKLNYSHVGTDIAKLIDLILFVKKIHKDNFPIIACGISHGAILAEIIGVISENIDAVVSICGTGRGDLFDRFKAGVLKDGASAINEYFSFSVNYNFLYNGLGIIRLLAPKPLVISISTHDKGEDKFDLIFRTIDYYTKHDSGDKIAINLFYGFHEPDPSGELAALENVLNLNG